MFYNAKNHHLEIDGDSTDFISFGTGKKNLVIIPGVGDGLKTAKGLAIPFALMYRLFAKDFTVYVMSRKINWCRKNFGGWGFYGRNDCPIFSYRFS